MKNNNKIKKRKEEILNISEKQDKLSAIKVIADVAIIIGAVTCLVNPGIGLSVAAIAGEAIVLCTIKSKKLDITENRLYQEIKHIGNTKNEFDTREESKNTKINKLFDLYQVDKRRERDLDDANTLTMLSLGINVVGTLSTVLNPLFVGIPVAGIVGTVIAGNNEIKKYKSRELTSNRINNLANDIEYQESKENENINIEEISYEHTIENDKEVGRNSISMEEVNEILKEYNEELDSMTEEERKEYYKSFGLKIKDKAKEFIKK